MDVQITVKDRSWNGERIVEVRRVSTLSEKGLRGIRRHRFSVGEFPEIGLRSASKSSEVKGLFSAWHGIESFDKSPALRTYEVTEVQP